MKYRKIDSKGDYSFGSGFSDFIYDKNAIAQAIKTKILLFYGEWWEQIDDGIPMFQSILGAYDTETVKLASNRLMIDRIRQVDGVTDVSEAKTNVIGRKLYLSYRVDTIYGQIEGGVEVG